MFYIYNYLALYIEDNVNNITFAGSYCLFLALVVKFSPALRSGKNFTTRAKNKQYSLQKSCYSHIKHSRMVIKTDEKNINNCYI